MNTSKIKSINVLGTRITATNPCEVLITIEKIMKSDQCGAYICVTGVHGVMESLAHLNIRQNHNNALMCVPDGMPMVWLSKLAGFKNTQRVYGPDIMITLLDKAAKAGYSNFFYGGKEGIAEELACKMKNRFKDLKIAGTYCPPFRPLTGDEEALIVEKINKANPDIIWVGLSTPKQELLMAQWADDKVNAKIMLGVGAAFDFHTGHLRQAPSWMQKAGLEWLFRLCVEPRRLWKRYLLNNPAFIFHCLLQKTGIKKYPLD